MQKKPIIPLRLQKGYVPDGWLGIIQGSKFFYDFTKEGAALETKRQQLLEAVRKATTVGPAPTDQKIVAVGDQPIHPVCMTRGASSSDDFCTRFLFD